MASSKSISKADSRPRLLPSDLAALVINLFFAVASFCSAGRARWTGMGLNLDRGILMGVVFLFFIILQCLIIRYFGRSRFLVCRFLRLFYPQAFLFTWFGESIMLSQLVSGGQSFDAAFANWDRLIFGFDPSIAFHKTLTGPYWTELFFAGYFSYYPLIILGWWILFARARDEEASRSLFIAISSFGLLLIWYVFFPVQGPKFFFPELKSQWYGHFDGFFFTWFMKGAFGGMSLAGAAFPSSHVAVALISLILNARYNRWLLPVIIPLTVLLFFSTVYIYAHYAVDVLAGMIAGLGLFFLFSFLYGPTKTAADRLGDAATNAGSLGKI